MSAPGSAVISRQSPPSRSAPIEAGTWYAVGMSERGPEDEPVLCRNLQQFVDTYGDRVSYGFLYDAADVFFREGGSRLHVGRVVGPSPVRATANLSDGSVSTATITATSAGVWGNDIDIVVTHDGSDFIVDIQYLGESVETTPALADVAALVAWAEGSAYIDVTDLGHNDPAVGTSGLASGTDDHGNATNATWLAALDLFTKDLGPGQVSAPGRTTAQGHQDVLEHAEANNRIALLDYADTATVATLTAAAATDRALDQARFGGGFSPWATVPGIAPGTTRTVPYSAVEAGILARNDAGGKSPNVAGAGVNGVSRYAIGLSQTAWSDAERETLSDAGVNVALLKYGAVETYGYRTLVDSLDDDTWIQLSNARLYMVIAAQADAIAERYVFAEIDGRGVVFSRLNGELTGMLLPFYSAGSLYGETAEDALFVDTGGQVNTPETIAAKEINAVISVRMSPFGETVTIYVSKVATTEAV